MVKKYRKLPVVVEAVQWDGSMSSALEIRKWANGAVDMAFKDTSVKNMFVGTLEGVMEAKPGDFIIKGVKGEFYPCKPDVFEKTYEEAELDLDEILDRSLGRETEHERRSQAGL